MTVEISALHFGMFSIRLHALYAVLLPQKGIRIRYLQGVFVAMQEKLIDPDPVFLCHPT